MNTDTQPTNLPAFDERDWSDAGFLSYLKRHAKEDVGSLYSEYQIDKLVRLAGESPVVAPTKSGIYLHLPKHEIDRLVGIAARRQKAR